MMTVPKIILQDKYTPKNGDFLLLPWHNATTPAFPKALLPASVREALKPPAEAGKTRILFRGSCGKAEILVQAVRLDAPKSHPAAELRKAVPAALKTAKAEGCAGVVVFLDKNSLPLAAAAQEGALLGGYVFDRYLTQKAPPKPLTLILPAKDPTLRRALAERAILFEYVNFARDLINEPPNVIKPPQLADAFQKTGRRAGLKIAVWDEKKLQRERCGGILAVGQGAAAPPRLVIAEYAPRGARKHLSLVGKGVTFDTGGYSLKPSPSQIGMQYDMAGAAAVFAAVCAIARLRLRIRVTAIAPLVENAISGNAYENMAVLTTRSGRTIEVRNTDAEGRLILADALALAAEAKPDYLVDAATLTGACVTALGEDIAAVFGTDSAFTKALIQAGADEGERFWEMPLHEPYAEEMKTTIADCKNIGDGRAGAIFGALFLKQWVPEAIKWIHCDVAGPAGKEKPLDHLDKGGKGFGVKTLVALASALAGEKSGNR